MSNKCHLNCDDNKDLHESNCEEKNNKINNVKHVIGVMSGKGGVGKSVIASLLACEMQKKDFKTAILDADITGPSIPKMFGLTKKAQFTSQLINPVISKTGIKIMSINLLLENDTQPAILRGPMLGKTVKQLFNDTLWEDIDYMLIDMPPGTADVPLTIFQSIPIDGIIIVTSPQDLVSMIVSKAVNMAKKMNVKIIGLVENYSYFICPDNLKKYYIFGESHIDEVANKFDLKVLERIPINPEIAKKCDLGMVEEVGEVLIEKIIKNILNKEKIKMKIAVACDGNVITNHFGHCENFKLFTTEDNKILEETLVPNPGHKPGFLPRYLSSLGVNVIISGGMGSGAVDIFNELGIEVIMGASGNARDEVQKFLNGALQSTGSICNEHMHKGECGK